MYFNEFHGVRISALAAAVPDKHEQILCYADRFPAGEIEKFCRTTGIQKRYCGTDLKTTGADLCTAAAKELFRRFDVDKSSVDGLIFLTQSPDYDIPSTSCVIQHRLGLDGCGLVYDSNIGCTGFPFGIQMACADLMAGCKKVLLLVGDADVKSLRLLKDDLLFGDCGIAMILEKAEGAAPPIRTGIRTIGKGYQALFVPYGGYRHPIGRFYGDRGMEDTLAFVGKCAMQGTDVFTFSIKEAPRAAKDFFAHFGCSIEDYDLISIHQANKMIVDNVAKRIQAPKEKVLWTLDRYGNTRGSSTALNICDYAERENVRSGVKRILNLAFGVGLNVALADMELDMSTVLPVVKTSEAYDDGIDSFTYFMEDKEDGYGTARS